MNQDLLKLFSNRDCTRAYLSAHSRSRNMDLQRLAKTHLPRRTVEEKKEPGGLLTKKKSSSPFQLIFSCYSRKIRSPRNVLQEFQIIIFIMGYYFAIRVHFFFLSLRLLLPGKSFAVNSVNLKRASLFSRHFFFQNKLRKSPPESLCLLQIPYSLPEICSGCYLEV